MGIVKAVMAGSFDFGTPAMSLAKVYSRGIDRDYLLKSASVLTREMEDVRPEKGFGFVHLIAVGDSETYSANRNGDAFPKKANEAYHHTFVTDAHVFNQHCNKDASKASGTVKTSAYNPDMHRIELLIKVAEDKWRDDLEKLANGELCPVSMACRVPYDICSVCRNQARTREDYCEHLRDYITKIAADGTHICAINDHPTFFDISRVVRNADRIAFGLRKVASVAQGGAALAEELGIFLPERLLIDTSNGDRLTRKTAALQRLAAMEKEVEGVLDGGVDHRGIRSAMAAVPKRKLTKKEAEEFHKISQQALFGALAKEAVLLPIQDFFRVLYGEKYPEIESTVEKAAFCLPGIFNKLACEESPVSEGNYDGGKQPISSRIKELVSHLARETSQRKGPGITRISVTIINGKRPELQSKAPIKEASDEANFLAKEYAKYAVAYLSDAGLENEALTVLTSLGNYVK